MPMNRTNQRTFHRTLFAGWMEKVRLEKRGDNQKQGTIRTAILYDCRRGMHPKVGETIQGDMNVGNRTVWHIPKVELERAGVEYLNPTDRIVQLEGEEAGRYWQPEATTTITVKLGGVHVDVLCLRIDPPKVT